MHAQRLVDMEREQAQMKAQVSALVDGENYLTVVGYCNLTGRRIDRVETARFGKLATAVCVWRTGGRRVAPTIRCLVALIAIRTRHWR